MVDLRKYMTTDGYRISLMAFSATALGSPSDTSLALRESIQKRFRKHPGYEDAK